MENFEAELGLLMQGKCIEEGPIDFDGNGKFTDHFILNDYAALYTQWKLVTDKNIFILGNLLLFR